jgi:hypothetical protein
MWCLGESVGVPLECAVGSFVWILQESISALSELCFKISIVHVGGAIMDSFVCWFLPDGRLVAIVV